MDDLFAGFIILIGMLIVFIVGFLAVYYVGLWKLFKKAGKNGWEAIVPFYNTWVLVEISGVAWWYALILIISSLGIFTDILGVGVLLSIGSFVANFFVCYNLSKKFHKDVGFAVLLFFFPFIMIPLIGLSGNYQYDSEAVVSENGPIEGSYTYHGNSQDSSHSEATMNYEEKKFCAYCGNSLNRAAKFCGNCGKEVK